MIEHDRAALFRAMCISRVEKVYRSVEALIERISNVNYLVRPHREGCSLESKTMLLSKPKGIEFHHSFSQGDGGVSRSTLQLFETDSTDVRITRLKTRVRIVLFRP